MGHDFSGPIPIGHTLSFPDKNPFSFCKWLSNGLGIGLARNGKRIRGDGGPPTPYASEPPVAFKFEPHQRPRHNGHRLQWFSLRRVTRPAGLLFSSPPVRSRAPPPMPTAASSSSAQPVRVVLRVRPFLPSEAASAGTPCVSLVGGYPGSEATVQLKDQYTRCATSVNMPPDLSIGISGFRFPPFGSSV
jgi:hypothetical protein